MRIQTRLALLLISVSVAVIASAGIFTTISLDDYFTSRIGVELSTQTREVDFLLRSNDPPARNAAGRLRDFAAAGDLRITLITREGTVLFDSDVPESALDSVENHADRPEVRDALGAGTATAMRHSATIGKDLLYRAQRLDTPLPAASGFSEAAVLRVAIPMTSVSAVQSEISSKILITSIVVLAFVVVLAVVLSRRLAQPIKDMAETAQQIQAGKLDQRIEIRSNDELGRLAASLNSMVDTLNADITKLRKLEQIRSEFLGNVSHELRTPIFSIQGMLETLLGGAIDDKEVNRAFVESALRNTERLNTLLADLIDISSIESGEMKMSFRYFSLREFLGSVVTEMLPAAARKEIPIEMAEIPAELEVLGDKERLRQVMVNLIDNAIKYSDPKAAVRVSMRQSGERIVIEVADGGVGIPADDIPRIFERFYRIDKERSRDAGGTGLGLAIVKHIVEAHGSQMSVSSVVGKGSTFSFSLPAACMPARDASTRYDGIILGGGAAGLMCAIEAGKRGRRVLVLERNAKLGEKILISGGGRCNFTNLAADPSRYLSSNAHFCTSALARFTPKDFLALVEKHHIRYHEKTAGQLFCDGSSREILAMLVHELDEAHVEVRLNAAVTSVRKEDRFVVVTAGSSFESEALVVATGGLSIPSLGASDFGYTLARQFGLRLTDVRPGLVPLVCSGADGEMMKRLSGVSVEAEVRSGEIAFRDQILFTHRGLSGPAILQISSYWQPGSQLEIDLLPGIDLAASIGARPPLPKEMAAVLGWFLPRRLSAEWIVKTGYAKQPSQSSKRDILELEEGLHRWVVRPDGTEGFGKAEVTCGGVSTEEISSKTMEAGKVPGLYFVGEVIDVTGQLGGYNFQWAWASGAAAGRSL